MKKSLATFYSLLMVFSLSACGSASLTLEEGLATAQEIRDYQSSEDFVIPNDLTISSKIMSVKPKAAADNPLASTIEQTIVFDKTHSYLYSYTDSYAQLNTKIQDPNYPDDPSKTIQKVVETTSKQWTYLHNDVLFTVSNVFTHLNDGSADTTEKTYQNQIFDPNSDTTFSDLQLSLSSYYTGSDVLNWLIGNSSVSSDGFFDDGYVSDTRSVSIKSQGEGYLKTSLKIKQISPAINHELKANFSNYYLSSYSYIKTNDYEYSNTKISVSHEANRDYPTLTGYTLITNNE